CEVWGPTTTGARRTASWPKPAGATPLVPATPEGRDWVALVAPVWGERHPGREGCDGEGATRCGQTPEACCRIEPRWRVGDETKAALQQEMLPARITPELRGAAKRHPLERIVRQQPTLAHDPQSQSRCPHRSN